MRPRPRTIEIVLEDPRGQGHVLEDSITVTNDIAVPTQHGDPIELHVLSRGLGVE